MVGDKNTIHHSFLTSWLPMFGFRHITNDKKNYKIRTDIYKPDFILVLFRSTKFTRQFRQLFLSAMLKILAHQVKIAVDFYIYGKSQTAALNLNIQIVLNSNGYTVNIFIIKMYTVIYRLRQSYFIPGQSFYTSRAVSGNKNENTIYHY